MLLLACLLAAAATAAAHPLSVSYAHLNAGPSSVAIIIRLPQDDLDLLLRIDRDLDGAVTAAEIEAAAPRLFEYVTTHMEIRGEPTLGIPRLVHVAPWADSKAFPYVEVAIEIPADHPRHLQWTMRQLIGLYPDHRTLADVEWAGGREQIVFQHGSTAELDAGTLTQLRTFLVLGVEHILTGYDHLLFLLALIITRASVRSVVVLVTAFTVAHSATLAAAALGVVRVPSWIVEAAIALSITYVAVENLRKAPPAGRWRIAFLFGLIHGLGFANVLGELSLPAGARTLSLLSFNAGVEIGQLGLIVMTWPILFAIHRSKYSMAITYWVSLGVAACGVFWFVERVW